MKDARGTPSVAIGSYGATPLDMAGAYTTFANGGVHLDPWLMASVRTPSGDVITDFTPTSKQVLDPRVAYLTTNLMEGVMKGEFRIRIMKRGGEMDSWTPQQARRGHRTMPGLRDTPAI